VADGALALELAEDSADALAAIEDRAEKEANTTLRLALVAVLDQLRRAFVRYQEAAAAPSSVSPAELTARYQEVIRAAQRFLTDGELQAWETSYRRHLEAAITAGAKAAEQQQRAEDPATPPPPFAGPDPVIVGALLAAAVVAMRSEAVTFRDQLVVLASNAAAQGWGTRRLEQEARRALVGITAPQAPRPGAGGRPAAGARRSPQARRPQTGVVQRVIVNLRTNLQQAAQQATQTLARAAGYQYARWIATRDERTCAYCVARHGRIYRLDQVSLPAHRRCRCQLQPLATDDVENPDADARERALNGTFWRQSQTRVWREYAASRGRSTTEVRPELLRAAATPTANERWRTPGTTRTAQPVVTLDGPGGVDLTTAVRQAARNANRQQPST
jgi:SPP1 gp7 family putative phage head morphogenesis protein